MADRLERWLGVAGNRGEWERLRTALALEHGFVLLLIDVPDSGSEQQIVERLASELSGLECLDVRDARAPVRELLQRQSGRFVVRGVEASRSDVEALERCLVQLNMRRDQLVASGHVLLLILRRDAVARMIDVAPDLYSVHRARFRFARLVRPRPAPRWLLTDAEFEAVLTEEYGRKSLAYQQERMFARRERVRCRVGPHEPHDLAHALEHPSIEYTDRLRHGLSHAKSSDTALLCVAALTWVNLQQSDVGTAREIHARLAGDRFELRYALLGLMLDAAEGIAHIDTDAVDREWRVGDTEFAAVHISFADALWDLWPPQMASRSLRLALSVGIEQLPFDKWRLDDTLCSLPHELVEAAIPLQARTDAIEWLHDRRRVSDRDWDETWVKHLMLERAVGHAGREAFLLDLGHSWLEARSDIYEVWRPLVEIHAEAPDASRLTPLIELIDLPDADVRFGVRLRAALHVVAELRERGLTDAPQQ